ncbi:hypothetical protein ACFPOD_14590 [Nitratireductor kimnyeongensis]|uniref:Uncharacterized protein n=1 Tax=Nitratireductor kimnyeongensis TaxID=430679 RepID=A0ABW0TD00_9HYPH|nr:hypothetical protein [Nitratireductor kimnyeongensis]QZZ36632.1 hypothetical protein KW403_05730 [Nitratireductor kimnyeongensis]
MQDENPNENPKHRSASSAGTRGFVIGAVVAVIAILVFMTISGSGLFGPHVTTVPGAVNDSVPTGDGE